MTAIVVFMVLMLALAVAVGAVVVLGMEGRGRDHAPELADKFARAAKHLNGDAQPPERLQHLFR